MSIGEEIKRLRLERDWTQDELAKKANINPATLRSIESGKSKNPTTRNLLKIARAFGKRPEELYQAAGYIKEAKAIYPRTETPEEILDRLRLAQPVSIPVYTEFPFHAGEPTEPVDYVYRTRPRSTRATIEGYIVHGKCLTPQINDGDIIIVDRETSRL